MRQVKRKTKRRKANRENPGTLFKRFCYERFVAPPVAWLDRVKTRVKEQFSWRHPVFLMAVVLCFSLAVVILLLSGVIGRTVRHTEDSVSQSLLVAGFGVSDVKITGLKYTPEQAALAALDIPRGSLTFGVDVYAARARLMSLPWVKDAVVRRRYPGSISVDVTEKVPYALWQTPHGAYIVEKNGAVITSRDVASFTYLPVLLGKGAPQEASAFVDAVRHHPAIAHKVALYQYQSGRRWNLIMTGGVTVKLPEFGWKKELGTLQALILGQDILRRNLNEIDLRSKSFYYLGGVPGVDTDQHKKQEGRAI